MFVWGGVPVTEMFSGTSAESRGNQLPIDLLNGLVTLDRQLCGATGHSGGDKSVEA